MFNCFACGFSMLLFASFSSYGILQSSWRYSSLPFCISCGIILSLSIVISAAFSKFTVLSSWYAADFLITYYKYQYKFAGLGFWNVFLLSQNCMYPQSLSSYGWSYPVLHTCVHTLKVRSFWCIYTREHNHHVHFISFLTCSNYFLHP